MSTLTPPVQLEHPENQFRVDYMQDVASQHNFEYTTVCYFWGYILTILILICLINLNCVSKCFFIIVIGVL